MTTSPLESLFDIEPGTTVSSIRSNHDIIDPDAAVDHNALQNDEDKEIATELATIYQHAIDAFEEQTQMVQDVDPRFAARNSEVAAQYLTIALNTVNTKAKIRQDKLKLSTEASKPTTVNNNIIVDRNEILRMLENQNQIPSK